MATLTEQLTRAAQGVLPTLANRVILGKGAASEIALVQERNALNQLNGSGSPDGRAALNTPKDMTEFTLSNPIERSKTKPAQGFLESIGMTGGLAIAAGIGVVVWLIVRK